MMETNIMHLLRGLITGCLFAFIVLSLASKAQALEVDTASALVMVQLDTKLLPMWETKWWGEGRPELLS